MIFKIFAELEAWNWWVFALVLLGLEIIAPGAFFIWPGLAAIVVGTISITVGPDVAFWTWPIQLLVFVVLSLVFAFSGRKLLDRYKLDTSSAPNINDRGQQLVGRTAIISDEISGGQGRAKVGDTTWTVTGPDLPVGTKVKVVGSKSAILQVEQLES